MRADGPRWDCKIYRSDQRGRWKTVWVGSLDGVMLDFVNTLASETATAFMYGEPRDLSRAAGSVHKQARRHAREHERRGTF